MDESRTWNIRRQRSCAKKTAQWWWTLWRLFGNPVYLCFLVSSCSKSWCTHSKAKGNRLEGFQQWMPELLTCWQSMSETQSIPWDRYSPAVCLKLLLVSSDSPVLAKSFPGFSYHGWTLWRHWVTEAFLLDDPKVWVGLQCFALSSSASFCSAWQRESFCSKHSQKCLCTVFIPTALGHSLRQFLKDPVIHKVQSPQVESCAWISAVLSWCLDWHFIKLPFLPKACCVFQIPVSCSRLLPMLFIPQRFPSATPSPLFFLHNPWRPNS